MPNSTGSHRYLGALPSGAAPAAVRWLYTGLFYLATPLILGRLVWRGRRLPAYRHRWRERFGFYGKAAAPGVIWFHAVSVGEAEAAFPLIRVIRERYPVVPILVTATTPTGSARIAAVLGDGVQHCYLPYDLPGCVRRFLGHFQPVLGVVLETEIWPNLFHHCGLRNLPLAIVNGRLSEKSAQGYRRVRVLAAESLARLSLIAAQTAADAERYRSIGAPTAKVVVSGNVKFDLEFSAAMEEQARQLRAELFGTRHILIAGSTHPGEEEQVLDAFRELRRGIPDLLLILVPRHPERNRDVSVLCARLGFALRRRSESRACEAADDVFLLDTLGELRVFYATADVAFVGGSLVPVGGHNVLEPAAAGVPVLFGPRMFNFTEVGQGLKSCGGGVEVADAGELIREGMRMLKDEDVRAEIGRRGRAFVAANRGAVARTADLIAALLPPATPGKLDPGD